MTKLQSLLEQAGVLLNGDRPWDVQVHDPRTYRRILRDGSLGVGETYMEGWWDCDQLDEMMTRVLGLELDRKLHPWFHWFYLLQSMLINFQKPLRAFEVGEAHYDIGNELYQRMLDRRMIYSCAYWRDAKTLDQAQEAKLDLIGRKLMLEPGMRVLDIGCGWGGTARFLVERFSVKVVGITISRKQADLAKEECLGLPVEIQVKDYREVNEKYDRIVSIGMFEHVGYHNYHTYFQIINRCLIKGGLFLLQTIGNNRSEVTTNPWVKRYIFPNSMLPSAKQISEAAEGLLLLEDWHNFGIDYDRTLMHWLRNFQHHWRELVHYYDERFFRMWKFYLLSCAGSFRARRNQLWQLVFSKQGLPHGYVAPR